LGHKKRGSLRARGTGTKGCACGTCIPCVPPALPVAGCKIDWIWIISTFWFRDGAKVNRLYSRDRALEEHKTPGTQRQYLLDSGSRFVIGIHQGLGFCSAGADRRESNLFVQGLTRNTGRVGVPCEFVKPKNQQLPNGNIKEGPMTAWQTAQATMHAMLSPREEKKIPSNASSGVRSYSLLLRVEGVAPVY
jgi:hypothetical protein